MLIHVLKEYPNCLIDRNAITWLTDKGFISESYIHHQAVKEPLNVSATATDFYRVRMIRIRNQLPAVRHKPFSSFNSLLPLGIRTNGQPGTPYRQHHHQHQHRDCLHSTSLVVSTLF